MIDWISKLLSKIKEEINPNVGQDKIAESISIEKANAISIEYPNDMIIGADTIVISNGKFLENLGIWMKAEKC